MVQVEDPQLLGYSRSSVAGAHGWPPRLAFPCHVYTYTSPAWSYRACRSKLCGVVAATTKAQVWKICVKSITSAKRNIYKYKFAAHIRCSNQGHFYSRVS